jgi:hypothetical protein
MTPTLLLRVAAVLAWFHCLTHTVGGVFGAPAHGADEIAVLTAMQAHRFAFMGSMRSYGDFFFGYGLIVAVVLAMQGAIFWQLATMARTAVATLRPLLMLFAINWALSAVLSGLYFFVAPAATQALMAGCLLAAWATARDRPRAA